MKMVRSKTSKQARQGPGCLLPTPPHRGPRNTECGRVVRADTRKAETFYNGCLRWICQIFWPNQISNHQLYKKTGSQNITKEITHRCLRWLCHVLTTESDCISRVILRWTPSGAERPVVGRGEHAAKDQMQQRELTETSCPIKDKGEYITSPLYSR